jgi:class 3 adenylate cyclase
MRDKDFPAAEALLDRASTRADADAAHGGGDDRALRAAVAHTRGALELHRARPDAALPHLREALALYGPGHAGAARTLDTIGMVHMGRDSFHTARELFEHALDLKERHGDTGGMALTHGNLGRLHLGWGNLEAARRHFLADLELARAESPRSAAQLQNFLGQAALEAGELDEATDRLSESVRRASGGGWEVIEGFARKDLALTCVRRGDLVAAGLHLQRADALLRFAEGQAHVRWVRGRMRAAEQRFDEAATELRAARGHFVAAHEPAIAARVRFDEALTLEAAGGSTAALRQALLEALDGAEACRRAALANRIEERLRAVDPLAHARRVYQRARGRGIEAATASLHTGAREVLSVMFLDLQGFTAYAAAHDPERVFTTLNQIFTEMEDELARHEATVNQYLGDGFMALFRGAHHATRAVRAALDLSASLGDFNRARALLERPPLEVRVGVTTGEAYLGNVGTYRKMDYTAVGTTTNKAARLQSEACPGVPCVCGATRAAIGDAFRFTEASPRSVPLKGLGEEPVWDVAGEVPG